MTINFVKIVLIVQALTEYLQYLQTISVSTAPATND